MSKAQICCASSMLSIPPGEVCGIDTICVRNPGVMLITQKDGPGFTRARAEDQGAHPVCRLNITRMRFATPIRFAARLTRRHADHSAAFSIGSLGRDKSDLLKGEGPIDSLLSRDDSSLFAMRLTRHDSAADKVDHLHIFPPVPSTIAYSIPRYSILAELVRGGFRSRPQASTLDRWAARTWPPTEAALLPGWRCSRINA